MDLFLPIVLFIVFCVLFSVCGWCCKKHREGTIYGYAGNPANVTVSTQPAAAVIPPYPVDNRHPQAHVAAPGPGFAPPGTGPYQSAAPYPTATPYPPPPAAGGYPMATPYPPGTGMPYPPTNAPYPSTNIAPYPPPAGSTPYPTQQLPPSYHEAVGQPIPPSEPHHEAYSKQAPYNPHY